MYRGTEKENKGDSELSYCLNINIMKSFGLTDCSGANGSSSRWLITLSSVIITLFCANLFKSSATV